MYKWPQSLIAAAGIYIAKKMLKRSNAWSVEMHENTGFTERLVRDCAKDLCILLNSASTKKDFEQLYKKFSLPKFLEVAKISAPSNPNNTSNNSHKTESSRSH